LKLARLHYRIRCLRDDLLHKISHQVTERYSFIGLEDLNLSGMFCNRKRALSASDAALGKLAQYLETKAHARGTTVQQVGRFSSRPPSAVIAAITCARSRRTSASMSVSTQRVGGWATAM
jgi:IS605 OrfB family transposase